MKKNIRHISIRIDDPLRKKFDYVANYDDRSMNWLMLHLIKECVEKFETDHGKIPENILNDD